MHLVLRSNCPRTPASDRNDTHASGRGNLECSAWGYPCAPVSVQQWAIPGHVDPAQRRRGDAQCRCVPSPDNCGRSPIGGEPRGRSGVLRVRLVSVRGGRLARAIGSSRETADQWYRLLIGLPIARCLTRVWHPRAPIAVGLAVGTLTAVTCVRTFDVYLVTSDSMVSTLLPGDLVVVNRRVGRELHAEGKGGRTDSVIGRREVWVFAPWSRTGDTVVKRIIGLPGDTVSMTDGVVYIDGTWVSEPYALLGGRSDPLWTFGWQREYLADPQDSTAYQPTELNWGPLVVPPGSYFVLGDNRGSSIDSRHRGFVSVDRMVGRAQWTALSYSAMDPGTIYGQRKVRWNRVGSIE